MGGGKNEPKLRPPPRVPAAGTHRPKSEPGSDQRSTSRLHPIIRTAVVAAMILGLVGVFVLLPRWQEQRQSRLAGIGETRAPAPPPEVSIPVAPEPSKTADVTAPEPSPEPTPAPNPTPAPVQLRNTPQGQPSEAERQYVEAMSRGLNALEDHRWLAAQDAFAQASRLRPEAPEVADGLARARAGLRRETVSDRLRKASAHEQNEAWKQAEELYAAVLAIDPESAAALEGRKRTRTRADLDEKLEFHIANPARLATTAVFDDAAAALEEALETEPSGTLLNRQIIALEAALKRASTPVSVVLESDSSTEVLLYQVGRLGTFTRRELSLKPGTYTVVGSRSGYRDVRLQLVVSPGSPPRPLVVRCTESL